MASPKFVDYFAIRFPQFLPFGKGGQGDFKSPAE
jgi:hypothetical protein